jgi:nucleoside-diphosphate-sugar epimerase
MRILFTGASSIVGRRVLERLLESTEKVEVWCTRHRGEVAADPGVHVIDLDLAAPFDEQSLPDTIDMTIHFAGVTHAHDSKSDWKINHLGTAHLAGAARARGCRRFVYISTRCATPDSGAYGESKLAAENELKKFDWESLLIIRPSEIYGAQGSEGVDKLIALARLWHLTPWLFGNSKISFAPLHIDDFAGIVADEIGTPSKAKGLRTVELCGPEDLNARELATRIANRYKALPLPLWWPLFALFSRIAAGFNSGLAVPDQLQRLVGTKTAAAKTANRTGRVRFLLD